MPKTPFRTPNDPLIVTTGDLIQGQDGTSPSTVLVRGGEDSTGSVTGAVAEFRSGDGFVTADGGAASFRSGDAPGGTGGDATFRGGDGTAGGDVAARGGDGSVSRGGNMLVRGGDGVSTGGILSVEGGAASTGTGGALAISGGGGPAGGGSVTVAAGAGSGGGSLSLAGGIGVSLGGNVNITGGDDTGTSGDAGDILITGGAITNGAGIGDGGSIILSVGGTAGTGSPGSLVFDYATWPAADGTSGQVLSTNGAGVLSWVTGGGGVSNLQGAYAGGNTIVTNGGDGAFDISGTEPISLDSEVSSNFTVSATSASPLVLTLATINPGAGSATVALTGDDVSVTNSVMRGALTSERFQILGGTQAALAPDGSGPSVYLRGQDSASRNGAQLTVSNSISGNGSIVGQGGNGLSGATSGGSADMIGGTGFGAGSGAQASIQAGDGGGAGGAGGFAFAIGGDGGGGGGAGGGANIIGGAGDATGAGGPVNITAGASPGGTGGALTLTPGSGATPGTIVLDGLIDRDADGYKFGLLGPGLSASNAFTFPTSFPAGPALVFSITIEDSSPPGLPPLPYWVHSISGTGFTLEFTTTPPPTHIAHWTVRQ